MATRSARRGERLELQKKQLALAAHYCNGFEDPPGFTVNFIDDVIGDGVFTTRSFKEGDFLLEYKGDLIKNMKHAIQLEKDYTEAGEGCFLFFFKCRNRTMCIDATNDIFGQGRMVNDARNGDPLQNCAMKVIFVEESPRLCVFATRGIVKGEELRYDYGVPSLPWRKKRKRNRQGNATPASERRIDNEPPSVTGIEAFESREDGNVTPDLEIRHIDSEPPSVTGIEAFESREDGNATPDLEIRHIDNESPSVTGIEAFESREDGNATPDSERRIDNEPPSVTGIEAFESREDGNVTPDLEIRHIDSEPPSVTGIEAFESREDGNATPDLEIRHIDNESPSVTGIEAFESREDGNATPDLEIRHIDNESPSVTGIEAFESREDGNATPDLEIRHIDNESPSVTGIEAFESREDGNATPDSERRIDNEPPSVTGIEAFESREDGNVTPDLEIRHIDSEPPSVTGIEAFESREDGNATPDLEIRHIDNESPSVTGIEAFESREDGNATPDSERRIDNEPPSVTGIEAFESREDGNVTPDLEIRHIDSEPPSVTGIEAFESREDGNATPDLEIRHIDNESPSVTGIEAFESREDGNATSDLERPIDNEPPSEVGKAKRNAAGNIVLDKYQYCYICNKAVLKLARHILGVHSRETDVVGLTVLKENPATHKAYIKQLTKFRNLGNFKHNINALKEGRTDLVLVKRPSHSKNVQDFLPCPHCYGFYLVHELWRHDKRCEFNDETDSKKTSTLIAARLILESAVTPFNLLNCDIYKNLNEDVLQKMMRDDIYDIIVSDKLILGLGSILLKKLGPRRAKDISQRMRQLARLLITANSGAEEQTSLETFISARRFDDLIQATEDLCGIFVTSDGRRGFDIPSLAVRLGHLLAKVAEVKIGICLRDEDNIGKEEARSFLALHKSEWTDIISSNALHTLKRRKDQQMNVIPVTEDLMKIRNYQQQQLEEMSEQVQSFPTYTNWRILARIIMTRLIIFNKRRGGEVAKMLLASYSERPNWRAGTVANAEVMATLDPLESRLLNRVDLVQIQGKKNRKVPVLITGNVKKAMDILTDNRDGLIPNDNPYFFASKSHRGFLDSWQAMNFVVTQAQVRNPEFVTSTKLRKYNATVCQLFDLNNGELEWLANHMGHDISIHKDFYRLHDSTIEIAKVSRLLMAIDAGKAAEFHGKKLEDININDFDENFGIEEDNPDVADVQEDMSIEEDLAAGAVRPKGNRATLKDGQSSSDEDEYVPPPSHSTKKRVYSQSSSEDDNVPSMSDPSGTKQCSDSQSSSEDDNVPSMSDPPGKKQCSGIKMRWTDKDVSVLICQFQTTLQKGIYPSSRQIERLQKVNKSLQMRTVAQIKAKLQHLMKGKNRL